MNKNIKILNTIYDDFNTKLIVLKIEDSVNNKSIVKPVLNKDANNDGIYFVFTDNRELDAQSQIKVFTDSVYTYFKVAPSKDIKTWTDAFIYLKRSISSKMEKIKVKKVVIFIDEMSYIDPDEKEGFINSFGYFYNTFCEKNENFLVVLSSSDINWIENRLLKDIGSLYQRVDKVINIRECKNNCVNPKN